jgi:uncharacterized repeat protein (TIGR01451 family)
MSSSTRTIAAQGKNCVPTLSARNLFCLVTILMLAMITANAQTIVTPATTTVQYLGVPNPQNNTAATVTAPLGGIILKGTAISPVTGQPFRHLWVADATSGICRIDPDLDSLGPYAINLQTCPFKINGASITGGPMAFDPKDRFLDPANPTVATNYLYFADEQRSSQGFMRIGYLPSGDSGHGLLNFASLFVMGGNTTGARFGGGTTGCPLPVAGVTGPPNAVVLSPLGDLWVGLKKNGSILRFNSPGTAEETGFGTCDQFIQVVGTDATLTNNLAFVGHDLWGADKTGPFFIKNADTTCGVPPHGLCSVASGDLVNVLPGLGAGTTFAVMSDQYYPATNGNNVYLVLQPAAGGGNLVWIGNASAATTPAGMAGTTLDTGYFGTFSPVGEPNPPLNFLTGLAVDPSDPANIVAYSAEDTSPLGTLAKGRWWQTCQGIPAVPAPAAPPSPYVLNCPTPPATAVPGAPLNVAAVAGESKATVSWNPAQVNQPVTSYTVINSLAVGGPTVATQTILPVAAPAPNSSNFPATSTVFTGLTDGVQYAFTVIANNASGSSAPSAQSNIVIPPGVTPPAAPGTPIAIAGDTQAFVSFTVAPPPTGGPITSYTVTSSPGGIITNTTPPTSGNTATALVGGLTNGVTYTFSVHANNGAVGPLGPNESGPSNPVTPSAAHVPVLNVGISGPSSVSTAPSQVTYTITVTNPINGTQAFPANVSVTHTLSPIGAVIAPGGALRNGGIVTITTTGSHGLNIGQSITIAGVGDPSFNGTFTIQDVPSSTTLTYAQAGLNTTNGSGTVTGLPLANIMLAQTSQGTCTAGGAGIITVTCNQGSLPAGSSSTMTVIVQIQSQAILNSVVASGTDAAGTALANSNASLTTTVPLPALSNISAPVSITGIPQSPNPNHGQAGNIVWTISNVSTTATPNVVFTSVVPAGLTINSITVTVDNAGVGTCGGVAPPANGGTITCTTPTLGGGRKNGAKPPSTMKVTVNVTPPAAGVFHPTGTVTFGPNGIDTLPNSVTLTITAK